MYVVLKCLICEMINIYIFAMHHNMLLCQYRQGAYIPEKIISVLIAGQYMSETSTHLLGTRVVELITTVK